MVHICDGEDIELGIGLQSCERTVTLIFADSCGQPIKGFRFLIDDEEQHTDSGVYNITPAHEGVINLSSRQWNLSPSEIHVGPAMAQAIVVQAAQRTVSLPAKPIEEEGFIIEFAELDPEQRAFVRS
jgi:hypothetical protein